MKQKLIITLGLPASGKSTFAKEQVKNNSHNTIRVNKDDLRAMINCSKWSKEKEVLIESIQDQIVKLYLKQGYNVIVDNTHLAPRWIPRFEDIARDYNVEFEIKDFTDVDVNLCIERDKYRENSVGKKVILDMWNIHLKKAPIYEYSDYIICDIDGTLAHMEGRSPYDGSKYNEDKVDIPIRTILQSMFKSHSIIIVSARNEKYRQITEEWLLNNNIPYTNIMFRKENDNREDSIVKQEILDDLIKMYNKKPLFVLDDRKRVVDMWRRNNIKCLQVEPGNF